MCAHFIIYLFCLYLKGVLINLPLSSSIFRCIVSWSGNVHFLCVIEYIFIIVFVTGLFIFSCIFSWCRLFLFMISPCSVFNKYDLGR